MMYRTGVEIGSNQIVMETGRVAKQAGGSVLVQCGGTVVLCTATADTSVREDVDFFPLMVDYRGRAYAAGKVPGGYFKREGRPSEKEILSARLIDRPIRPLFPDGFSSSTHVVCFVLSHDQQHEPDILGILGASAALMISDVPFEGPVSPVRVGRINEGFIANPTADELLESDINLTVVSTRTAVVMVEGGSNEVDESVVVDAIDFAFRTAQPLNALQLDFAARCGREKRVIEKKEREWLDMEGNPVDLGSILDSYRPRMREAIMQKDKLDVYRAIAGLKEECATRFSLPDPPSVVTFGKVFGEMEKSVARDLILSENQRNDGRGYETIRDISCDIDVLPCVHGSALFTRGQTQALVTLTLGTTVDEQRIDDIEGETFKSFMLHYNFPPFSVGESGFIRGPGRREVGHGALAERAIGPIIPSEEVFPYTIRIVSDIMESNGSSSMASVCGASLSLMDGGVPIERPVAGIAMGLILEGDQYAVLSDISGLEDHLGDMDFKVAGTEKGITAIQMDIKLRGFDRSILREALEQARRGRMHILGKMLETIPKARQDLKPYAPRIHMLQINPDKIGAIVGPGGKVIRALTAETGVKIDIEDDGTVKIASPNQNRLEVARKRILALVEEATVGKDYTGVVRRIESYGAFIEILPGTEGLLHISRMANYRVREVRDEFNIGDEVLVRVADIDPAGKVKLTRSELMDEGIVKGNPPAEGDSRTHPPSGDQVYNRDRRGSRDKGSTRRNFDRESRPRDNSHPPRYSDRKKSPDDRRWRDDDRRSSDRHRSGN